MLNSGLSFGCVQSSFAKSLAWISIAISFSLVFLLIANVINVDFLHINPNRTQVNGIATILIFAPIIVAVGFFGVAVVFTVSGFFQALVTFLMLQRYGRKGLFGTFLLVPLTTLLTWYCYEYLTPTDFNLGINQGEDWVPYQFGLTIQRYLLTLLFQACVTIFCLVRLMLEMKNRYVVKSYLLIATLLCAVCVGLITGFMQSI